MLESAGEQGRDWLTYGRSYTEQRHSPLTQINKGNLDELGLAWTIDLGTKRGIQSTPLVVDGIMFMSGPWSVVYAIDARKGELLWTFDPEVDRSRAMVNCCGVVNRGVALYKGSVFVATLDGSVYSLDAADWPVTWEAKAFEADGTYYSSTGAIRLFDGKVLIGNGGAEFHARGYVSALTLRPAIWSGGSTQFPATQHFRLSIPTSLKLPRLGRVSGGSKAVEVRPGIAWCTTLILGWCISVLAMGRTGTETFEARMVATTYIFRALWPWTWQRVPTAGITKPHPVILGITRQRSR